MDRRGLLRLLYPWARRYWRLRRPVTLGARALLVAGDAVLLVRHGYGDEGAWIFPGGAVDRGETVVDAALRELREECGIRAAADAVPLLGLYFHTTEGKHDHVAVVVCRAPRQAAHGDGAEIAEAAWHALDALPRVVPGVRRALADYARGARGEVGRW